MSSTEIHSIEDKVEVLSGTLRRMNERKAEKPSGVLISEAGQCSPPALPAVLGNSVKAGEASSATTRSAMPY